MLVLAQGVDGSSVPYIQGRLTDADWNQFLSRTDAYLTLNQALGWDGSLGALEEIGTASGRGLHVLPLEIGFDVSRLEAVCNLSYLYLGRGCEGVFDSAKHFELEHLRVFSDPKRCKVSFGPNESLSTLACSGAFLKRPEDLGVFRSLQRLEMVRPGFPATRLPDFPDLTHLDIYSWPKLESLSAFIRYPLRSLALRSCRNILDYSGLAEMRSLMVLLLDDCASLPDAKLVARMESLRELILQGTEFLEKDISALLTMNLASCRLSGTEYLPSGEAVMKEING